MITITNIFSIFARERLEGDSNYFILEIHHGPAAVAWIDSCVYLNG